MVQKLKEVAEREIEGKEGEREKDCEGWEQVTRLDNFRKFLGDIFDNKISQNIW